MSKTKVSPMFSIITVVYNGEESIKSTLESINSQSFLDYEHIIFDGCSDDNTLDVCKNHSPSSIVVSEKDKGIYDAMNKALRYCSGDYVIFMNSGDVFFSDDILGEISNCISIKPDLIIGNTAIDSKDRVKKRLEMTPSSIRMTYCHQSIFYKRSIFDSYSYDLSLKLVADFHLTMKVITEGGTWVLTDTIVSIIESGGVSDIKRLRVYQEYLRAGIYLGKSKVFLTVRLFPYVFIECVKSVIKWLIK